jgi:hypothetical protein
MFMPSARHWEEMQSEPVGFWPVPINSGDEYAFLLKAPTNVIKAAIRSCPVSLFISTASTPIGDVMASVLSVADDPASPMATSGVLRHLDEQRALVEILRLGQTRFIFFDELSRPVARADCVLGSEGCVGALERIAPKGPWYTGPWIAALSEVLDEVDAAVDPTRSIQPQHSPTLDCVPLNLSNFVSSSIHAIGEQEVLAFRLDDSDEGAGLEQTTWHLLENLFGNGIYRSPQVPKGVAKRELTDILVFCEAGIGLFEAKAMAVLNTDPNRRSLRRARNIEKQIEKGISQLVGAMRNLSAGPSVISSSGVSIHLPDSTDLVHHCVVMVSELHPNVDWESVAGQLVDASRATNALFHVLDLSELRLLVGVSGTPQALMTRLAQRFGIMVRERSAFLRMRIAGAPPP